MGGRRCSCRCGSAGRCGAGCAGSWGEAGFSTRHPCLDENSRTSCARPFGRFHLTPAASAKSVRPAPARAPHTTEEGRWTRGLGGFRVRVERRRAAEMAARSAGEARMPSFFYGTRMCRKKTPPPVANPEGARNPNAKTSKPPRRAPVLRRRASGQSPHPERQRVRALR